MLKRLKSWARTLTKLALLVLGYFWIGAAYKLLYAQTHDLTRFQSRLPISFYQQQFMVESLIHQTWMFGPDFQQYIGELPSLGLLVTFNVEALAGYCQKRESQLTELPQRYPYSLFNDEALNDAHLFSWLTANLNALGARVEPKQALAVRSERGPWRSTGLADLSNPAGLAQMLADGYPDSPQAPAALMRMAAAAARRGDQPGTRAIYKRIALEYPRSAETEEAANSLARIAQAEGRLVEAREYKRRGVRAAENRARERSPGKALPASSALTILGFRVDLSGIELQLRRVQPARQLLAVAARETERLRALSGLQGDLKERLRDTQERMDKRRNDLWVADMFEALKVGVPGPPPRPQEHPVTGQALIDGRPLHGVEVILTDKAPGRQLGLGAAEALGQVRLRAVTDSQGRFRIPGVPSGRYHTLVVYSLRPAETKAVPVVPLQEAEGKGFPSALTVAGGPVKLPPLRFTRAIAARSFGERPSVQQAVRLDWEPWPGAAHYRVEVLAAPEAGWAFQRRGVPGDPERFLGHPVLWASSNLAESRVDCPLTALAPDEAATVRAVQYEYVVTARDRSGKRLAVSARPLGRFRLSPAAAAELMKLRPSRGGRGRGLRPRLRPRRR
jgi:hypothetical protein